MICCKKLIAIIALTAILAMMYVGFAIGAVSSQEAANLGKTLTRVGGEMKGNEDGSIPPYTGGLTVPPSDYVAGSGVRTDPFKNEQPLFTINAQNMAKYANKLTEGTKALMKKHPDFEIKVYQTHRTVAFPEYVLANTAKNALTATTYNNGYSIKGARAGYPFPIPKNGAEAMWNHQLRFSGRSYEYAMQGWNVDASGRPILSVQGTFWFECPYYDSDTTRSDADLYWKSRFLYTGPARRAGEDLVVFDPINITKGRTAWLYLPGQRRVRLAPEVAFDTPNAGTSGANTNDDYYLFNGSMERYNWKLVGKKEMYIPYNSYKTVYQRIPVTQLLGPKFMNPDRVRWELHRVWVVEATLKPGARHIYKTRQFYLDEDCWAALSVDNYDARDQIYRVGFCFEAPNYDLPGPSADMHMFYDLIAGVYNINAWFGWPGGKELIVKVRPEREWTPENMAARAIR
jgi:hypothetical protein